MSQETSRSEARGFGMLLAMLCLAMAIGWRYGMEWGFAFYGVFLFLACVVDERNERKGKS